MVVKLIFCFTLYSSFLYAQNKKIVLIDSLSKQVVNDVLLRSPAADLYSNMRGEVFVDSKSRDTFLVTHPNYVSKVAYSFLLGDTLYILPKSLKLKEITVKPIHPLFFKNIGYYPIPKKEIYSWEYKILAIIGVHIPCPKKESYIDKIMLGIKANRRTENYNVFLYAPDSTGKPGKTLYAKNIVADSLKEEGVIDVRELKIKIPEQGIIVAVENTKIYDLKDNLLRGKYSLIIDFTHTAEPTQFFIYHQDLKYNPDGVWFGPVNTSVDIPCFGLRVYQK